MSDQHLSQYSKKNDKEHFDKNQGIISDLQ